MCSWQITWFEAIKSMPQHNIFILRNNLDPNWTNILQVIIPPNEALKGQKCSLGGVHYVSGWSQVNCKYNYVISSGWPADMGNEQHLELYGYKCLIPPFRPRACKTAYIIMHSCDPIVIWYHFVGNIYRNIIPLFNCYTPSIMKATSPFIPIAHQVMAQSSHSFGSSN